MFISKDVERSNRSGIPNRLATRKPQVEAFLKKPFLVQLRQACFILFRVGNHMMEHSFIWTAFKGAWILHDLIDLHRKLVC